MNHELKNFYEIPNETTHDRATFIKRERKWKGKGQDEAPDMRGNF